MAIDDESGCNLSWIGDRFMMKTKRKEHLFHEKMLLGGMKTV